MLLPGASREAAPLISRIFLQVKIHETLMDKEKTA